jgi:hypothetical protein
MDAKQLGAQPAAPFAAYEEEIKVKPTQHSGLTKFEAAFLAALTGFCAGMPDSDAHEIVWRTNAVANEAIAELAKERAP